MAGALLYLAFPVLALELLPDPTRPAVDTSTAAISGAGVVASGVGATESAQVSTRGGLQSVILSPQYRAAVINGQTVSIGEKVGDATLVEVRERSVVLQGAQGKRVMELFPGVYLVKTQPIGQKAKADKPEKALPVKNKKKKKHSKKISETANSGQNKDEREGK